MAAKTLETRDKAIAIQVLASMEPLYRDAITRVYLNEEPPAQTCADLFLSYAQLQRIKDLARDRFDRLKRREHAEIDQNETA